MSHNFQMTLFLSTGQIADVVTIQNTKSYPKIFIFWKLCTWIIQLHKLFKVSLASSLRSKDLSKQPNVWPIRRFRWEEDSLSSVMKASGLAYLEKPWKPLIGRVVLDKYIQNGIWVSEATMKRTLVGKMRKRAEENLTTAKCEAPYRYSQPSLPSFGCFRETIQKTNY